MAFTTRQAASEDRSAQEAAAKPSVQLFNDQRASTAAQLKQQQMMISSQSAPLQRAEDEELLQGKFATAQLMEEEEPLQGKFVAQRVEEEEPLQGKFATAQLMEEEEPIQGKFEPLQRAAEEEEPLQGKFSSDTTAQLEQKPNNTGMPNNLKSGIENLSGYSMDDVKVHYNSAKPAQLNAHAYAQGTDIHVAPGQEQHLPHEAWHVVQQKQGRVQPTMQMKAGVPVNDDAGLENEADVMGGKALMTATSSQVPMQKQSTDKVLIQRKNLVQSGLLTGITDKGTTVPVSIPNVTAVKVYEGTLPKSESRLEALKAASASQAVVGKAISGRSFTGNEANFNKSSISSLDPFIYRTKTSYGENSTSLELDYQNSHKFTGYVVKVNDGATGQSSTMVDDPRHLGQTGEKGVPSDYSNAHADTGSRELSGLISPDKNKTKDVNEQSVDAITKIAGEGARWVAVRNHASKITDRSWFFTRVDTNKDPKVKGVSFRNLWLSWKSAFNKAYGVPDETFKSTIKTKGGDFNAAPGEVALSQCDSGDYDLDNSRSHT